MALEKIHPKIVGCKKGDNDQRKISKYRQAIQQSGLLFKQKNLFVN